MSGCDFDSTCERGCRVFADCRNDWLVLKKVYTQSSRAVYRWDLHYRGTYDNCRIKYKILARGLRKIVQARLLYGYGVWT